jgi:hypothetical protein
MSGRVVHVNDNVEGAVYIGRAMPRKGLKASPFANPWKIGAPASHWGQADPITREGALFAYSTEIWGEAGSLRHLIARLPELRDKPLACWCRHDGVPMTNGTDGPDNRCHGDLLVHWLAIYTDDDLRAMAAEAGHP